MSKPSNAQPWTRRGAAAVLLLALGGTAGYVAADPFSTPEGVPRLVTYQGSLTQNGTAVADGTHTLRFELFTVASGGTPVWTSVRSVQTQGGRFATTLGDTSGGQPALVLNDFAGGDLYLEAAMQVAAGSYEVLGRQRVTSVPYALRAATAATSATATAAASAAAGSALESQVNAAAAMRIEQVVAVSQACVSTPCLVDHKTSGVERVDRLGTGSYRIRFFPGTFSSGNIVCSGMATQPTVTESVIVGGVDSNPSNIDSQYFATRNDLGGSVDSIFRISCTGPR